MEERDEVAGRPAGISLPLMALGALWSGGASGEAAQGDGTARAGASGGDGTVLDDGQRGEHPGAWFTWEQCHTLGVCTVIK